jgi:hypothetical protein
MLVVYVAGKFTGKTAWDVECNIRKAETLGLEVSRLGCSPLIPHTNTRFFMGEGTYEFWIQATLALLTRCDCIITTDDWEQSSGARGEVKYANEHGIPHFRTIAELKHAIDTGAI